jgi:thymidylate synthase
LHKWQNGRQWRAWPGKNGETIDQISKVLHGIKHNRRHVVVAYNPTFVDEMALPPCHALFQFYVANGKSSCQLYQRSADTLLGVPFNIASYALLTHMMAQQCELDVGDFVWTGGDTHLYANHMQQVQTQLSRKLFPLPTLKIKRKPDSLCSYNFNDFEIQNCQHHPHISAPVAV